jgi:hypothetical protein
VVNYAAPVEFQRRRCTTQQPCGYLYLVVLGRPCGLAAHHVARLLGGDDRGHRPWYSRPRLRPDMYLGVGPHVQSIRVYPAIARKEASRAQLLAQDGLNIVPTTTTTTTTASPKVAKVTNHLAREQARVETLHNCPGRFSYSQSFSLQHHLRANCVSCAVRYSEEHGLGPTRHSKVDLEKGCRVAIHIANTQRVA